MPPYRSTTAMLARFAVISCAAMCVPVLVNGVAMGSSKPPTFAAAVAVAGQTGPNPFGTIDFDFGSGQPQAISSNSGFESLGSEYFGRMMSVPIGVSKDQASAMPKTLETVLPVGCEALGGVSTKLSRTAGRCVS